MMDSLKLSLRAVDELQPPLVDLMESINAVPGLTHDDECKLKVRDWLTQLHTMRAHHELDDAQIRQMSFDLDAAYNAFHRFVQGK